MSEKNKIGDFRPQSRYIAVTVQDGDIFTTEDNKNSNGLLSDVPFPMTLNNS